jgi:hypothetical protein
VKITLKKMKKKSFAGVFLKLVTLLVFSSFFLLSCKSNTALFKEGVVNYDYSHANFVVRLMYRYSDARLRFSLALLPQSGDAIEKYKAGVPIFSELDKISPGKQYRNKLILSYRDDQDLELFKINLGDANKTPVKFYSDAEGAVTVMEFLGSEAVNEEIAGKINSVCVLLSKENGEEVLCKMLRN